MSGNQAFAGVTELQGPYGPVEILEGRIQEIWALQAWQRGGWQTRRGRTLAVRHPGTWNRGAGPDFLNAVLEVEGRPLVGDVEIHLYREDWWRHGHDRDPAYNRVVLHVVLFAGGMERPVRTYSGEEPEEWVLGPWLREDLESVSGGEPGLFGELVPELCEWMEADPPETVRERLLVGSDRRWQAKESMARCLLREHGWEEALHRMVLYYLGFPHNRRAFFQMAELYELRQWRDPGLLDILESRWREQVRWGAGRPANRAGLRLGQYLRLNREVPDWSRRLRSEPGSLRVRLEEALSGTAGSCDSQRFRRLAALPDWERLLREEILGACFNRNLAARLWLDVFLPMLAGSGDLSTEQAAALWFHWPPADFPGAFRQMLRRVLVRSGGRILLCNGWIQGLLWMEDQARIERIRRHSGAAAPGPSGSGA